MWHINNWGKVCGNSVQYSCNSSEGLKLLQKLVVLLLLLVTISISVGLMKDYF